MPIRSKSREARIVLPWPPSVNTMFVNVRGKGRVRSENYNKWIRDAGWMIRSQRVKPFDEPVSVTVELNPPDNRAFDLDNKSKALLDLLVKMNVIPDDNRQWVRSVAMKMVRIGAPCTVILESAE